MILENYGTITRFDTEYFEHTLDRIATTHSGKRMWRYLGEVKGERVYVIDLFDGAFIRVRSSIQGDFSASVGEDSIRCWLINLEGAPLSVKLKTYVTRRPGWESRLRETFTKLRQLRLAAGDCCGQPRNIRRAKTERNRGRLFCTCSKCDSWGKWLS